MTDTLRTRIIAALLSEDDVALMADAVIRKLQLQECDVQDCRCRHRYVTEWAAEPQDGEVRSVKTNQPTSAPGAGFGVNLYPVGAESNIPMTPRVYPKGEGHLTISGQSLTREEAEMFAKLRSTVPGEGLAGGGDRPGGEPIRGHWANAGPPIGLYPTRLPVHSHGPEEGAGMACRERWVDGRLIGACLPDAVNFTSDSEGAT